MKPAQYLIVGATGVTIISITVLALWASAVKHPASAAPLAQIPATATPVVARSEEWRDGARTQLTEVYRNLSATPFTRIFNRDGLKVLDALATSDEVAALVIAETHATRTGAETALTKPQAGSKATDWLNARAAAMDAAAAAWSGYTLAQKDAVITQWLQADAEIYRRLAQIITLRELER